MTTLGTAYVVVAAVCLVVGLQHLGAGWRLRERRVHLLFAGAAAANDNIALSGSAEMGVVGGGGDIDRERWWKHHGGGERGPESQCEHDVGLTDGVGLVAAEQLGQARSGDAGDDADTLDLSAMTSGTTIALDRFAGFTTMVSRLAITCSRCFLSLQR